MKHVFLMGVIAGALLASPTAAREGGEPAEVPLQPFEFAGLSTITPVGDDWIKSNSLCFEPSNSNAIFCPAYKMNFTGVSTIARLTLTDRKLSSLWIDWKYLDYDTVAASLTAKYGAPCRKDVWCFATGELTVFDHPLYWPTGPGVTVRYEDRENVEIKEPATAKVDF